MKRIGVIGASARSAAQSLKWAGYTPVAADLFADVDLCRIAEAKRITDYPNQFSGWMKEQSLDAWIYTGALENYPELVDELAQIVPLWGISGQLLGDLRDPLWLAKQCDQHGIPFPETLIAKNQLEGSWLAKSYRHSSGLGVRQLATESDWQEAERNSWYAQQRVGGRSCSAAFRIDDDGSILLGFAIHLVNDEKEWSFRGAVVTNPTAEQHKTLCKIGDWLYATGARGIVGIDFIDSGDELWLLEVNPRYTATIELFEKTYDAYCFDRNSFQSYKETSDHWGKLIYYSKQPVIIKNDLHEWIDSLTEDCFCADIPHINVVIEEGQPLMTLFAKIPAADSSPELFKTVITPYVDQLEQLLYGEN